ncbi:hypothetical protein BGW36DRAFT_354663 [Talaromyces proteolyticus]|uniref:Uncharacterized protein n=1 Tax=Talaromyces proteolyticus TaxID=1131652 RepID=A0AAD4Q4P8_9EURO|nr:uncharacterized protein BGW36DRAFT_354663 [Talaromyces proteolyticus]KAH8703235.1 hypothetical protein BGW36DRAFT_354663 [Talaromyces proteolyticus]
MYDSTVRATNRSASSLPIYEGACVDLAPLGFLLADSVGQTVVGDPADYCITNLDGEADAYEVDEEIAHWLSNFNHDTERLTNAFTTAAYLGNQARIESDVDRGRKTLVVSIDMEIKEQQRRNKFHPSGD